MQLRKHNSRRITHFQKIYDRNYGQETPRQINERKETRDEKSDRNDQANNIREENNKNTIPEALISNREKEIKEEPIQRMDKFNLRPRNKFNNNRPCRFCNAPNWNQSHKCPALDQTCKNCGKKGRFARACRQKDYHKRKIRNVTENEASTIDEESDESESSIFRIERINRIVDKNKYLTTTVKINGTEKEFIIDTGSPISIMPADKTIVKDTEIQKVRHRYQDVNKNEVKKDTGRHRI